MGHVSTHHGPETRLSRIDIFRLKQAERRRNDAIAQAHRQYAADIDAVFANEAKPQPTPAIANAVRWPWLADLCALARGLR
jgi:hypothetical protein